MESQVLRPMRTTLRLLASRTDRVIRKKCAYSLQNDSMRKMLTQALSQELRHMDVQTDKVIETH